MTNLNTILASRNRNTRAMSSSIAMINYIVDRVQHTYESDIVMVHVWCVVAAAGAAAAATMSAQRCGDYHCDCSLIRLETTTVGPAESMLVCFATVLFSSLITMLTFWLLSVYSIEFKLSVTIAWMRLFSFFFFFIFFFSSFDRVLTFYFFSSSSSSSFFRVFCENEILNGFSCEKKTMRSSSDD